MTIIIPFAVLVLTISGLSAATVELRDPAKTSAIPRVCTATPNNGLPRWESGRLLCFNRFSTYDSPDPNFFVSDGNGKLLLRTRIWLPEIWRLMILDAAVNGTAGYVVSGVAFSNTGVRAAFLAKLDNSGGLKQVIQLSPYEAEVVRAAPDGSFWTLGLAAPEDGIHMSPYSALHQYSAEGKLLKEVLPRSSFNTPMEPALITKEGSPALLVGSDRLYLFVPQSSEWIEVSLRGEILLRKSLKPPAVMPTPDPAEKNGITQMIALGAAVTSSGEVYASFYGGTSERIRRLNRTLYQWEAMGETSGLFPQIMGSDGDTLVGRDGESKNLLWRQPAISH